MPRSLWNGTIAFGLVSVPVQVFTATESKTVRFREVHLRDGAPIQHRRFCTREDREVPYEEVVRGLEVEPGEWVVLAPDELAAAAGDRAHRIDVEHFVPAGDVDPIFYERTWFVGAGRDGGDAYRLLHAALESTGRAAIGRWTFHDRERLVAVRPRGPALVLHTLRFADELVSAREVEVPEAQRPPSENEVTMAARLVDTLHEEFRPDRYEDEYRKAVLAVIERKARGQDVAPPPEPEPEPAADLEAALRASLERAGARSR